MRVLFLLAAYLLVLLLPIGLAWSLGWPPRPWHQELAAGLGMLAFSVILVEFVLSGRFRGISSGIGMDVTMRVHQVMARVALGFAVLHPLLYGGTASGGPRPWDVTRQLSLATGFSDLVPGIVAFVLLPALVLSAVARTQQGFIYETWRVMHGAGALLIAGLILWHAIEAGRYGSHPILTGTWVAMTALAIASLLFVYLVEPLRQSRRRWRVVSRRRLTPRQWELRIAPDGHPGLVYKAGQFVWLKVGRSPFSVHENPFSISSAPQEGSEVSFLIKELGDFTGTLGQIQPGTSAYLNGPHGTLSVDGRGEPGIVLIAGGVGVAPMLSILRQNRRAADPRAIRLIYGNRLREQIVYADELAREDVVHVLSEPAADWTGETGYVDGELLDRVLSDEQYQDWLFVLCGPTAMMDVVEDHLISRGTPSHRILSERFDYD